VANGSVDLVGDRGGQALKQLGNGLAGDIGQASHEAFSFKNGNRVDEGTLVAGIQFLWIRRRQGTHAGAFISLREELADRLCALVEWHGHGVRDGDFDRVNWQAKGLLHQLVNCRLFVWTRRFRLFYMW
jgi:hypothetical protein